jgi:hypothetical protein
VIGGIERDHFFGQWFGACEDRGKGIGNRHQGHGQNSWLVISSMLARDKRSVCAAMMR